ncbi:MULTISPECIES: ectoine/hydroxyectoine ABC transporter substrate-binding protein EhuB [Sutcliffiella]|uniref:Ectoine/hydroxyectoine ABC transporter substrate-binding protein EhuB n=1 Tax=Sutcliffiella cohnii TaxID=33932 RepID=A0A223KNF9_9BACI|nr:MULTISPECIES: ectoine/hydroxyectoine ABC transporter substrate-binding protein EhuB [Sutcliffiella]AST90888.1 ectoine/hydroxyectoine ABC transporter substrate-binding protein EhuB [Sutcliffiella cohnii]MED4017819.1 ectoine/hydroxyectoine ABC transporter substrate-binding protein EhuB [Sutcliffiella cohnii]WBL16676.1 ectoine/hydroxyectoine ABC transporter substrate-binding protein EhuB [Sutcliffiella sp. NC1]
MKKFITIFTITIFTIVLAACSSTSSGDLSTLERAKEEGKITIGFAGENPYAYQTADGELTGQSVEVARAVFQKLGIEEMDGVLTEFGSLINGLQAERFDVVTAGMYITPDRCERVQFGEPEYSIGEALAVQSGNPYNLHSYEDIAANPDVKIAVMEGAIELSYLDAAGVSQSQIEIVSDIPSNVAALQSGRVDAITMTSPTLEAALATANADNVERVADFEQPIVDGESVRGYGAAAFRLADEEFVQAYNEALQELKDSGELLEIISEFGFTEDDLPGDMTAAELCGS